ncbi:MAG: fumarylacetoacetate hydrolase family protein [Acidobacteriota bacterium]|nr:fumarylacetoacetate hydrolase family protein [Acidobacteriota bacterium]
MTELFRKTRNIHAVGLNYTKHVEEMGSRLEKEPVVFAKSPACLTSADAVHFPDSLGVIHHEAELVLRLGRDVPMGKYRNLDCVSHVFMGIDFTARHLQTRYKQNKLPWHRAKNFRHAAWVFPTEPADPNGDFTFELRVNGKPRQQGDSSRMIHSFNDILAFINRTFDLHEGDLVYTGTPAGVGPVNNGDTVRVTCPQLATDQTVTVKI